ncbi:serine/threonine-protein kinase fray2-like [Watersipora subatra]|uniref:serine/threonine-protein kinase fray2-like n=1 Tax=Watersipora subatra TaxID=2589382 RepID=UPI00355C250E
MSKVTVVTGSYERLREDTRSQGVYRHREMRTEFFFASTTCEDRKDVGYDRRGSSRRSGGSRDNSHERYGSRDSSRERYRGRESPPEIRDKFSRYKDNSMDRFEGEKYKEGRATSRYEGYRDSSKGRSVRFSGSRDKYEDDS